jgi:branched-chain amino acid transport system permease protein
VGTLIVGIALGILTERIFLDKLIGEPVLAVIMVTVGLSFFLQGHGAIHLGDGHAGVRPPGFEINRSASAAKGFSRLSLELYPRHCLAAGLCCAFFKYTRWGLSMQATADDETAALSLGVSARFVYAAAWAIAFMSAGVGGALLGNINGINISVGYLGLLVLPAVVLGGLNSVPGAIVGGIIIGVLQNLSGAYLDRFFPGGVKEIAPFVFMAVFLLFKPYGLWGWERIERV